MDQPSNPADRRRLAREVIRHEAAAIAALADSLGAAFEAVVDLLLSMRGRLVVSGMGKAGLIGAKLSATFASTGTPSYFLHPAEAFHGDLGRVHREDVVLLMSNSGESEEIVRLLDPLRKIGSALVAMCGRPESTLARHADHLLDCGRAPEACPLGLAPTASTAAMLALGDALAMCVQSARGFGVEDFARYHPGGALGRKLLRVDEVMRSGQRVTFAHPSDAARAVLLAMNATPGRPGAALIVDAEGRLVGFFTDGDLARQLQRDLGFLERPISEVMTREPLTIAPERLASEALRSLRERRVDQLPVCDQDGRALGVLDVQDLLAARVV